MQALVLEHVPGGHKLFLGLTRQVPCSGEGFLGRTGQPTRRMSLLKDPVISSFCVCHKLTASIAVPLSTSSTSVLYVLLKKNTSDAITKILLVAVY